jgi:hypothetical protein
MGTKAAIGVVLCNITAGGIAKHNTRTLALSGMLRLTQKL